jgi:hypothetical protein
MASVHCLFLEGPFMNILAMLPTPSYKLNFHVPGLPNSYCYQESHRLLARVERPRISEGLGRANLALEAKRSTCSPLAG